MNVTEEMTRPIVGIEHRTAQEVFDIMADRIRRGSRHVWQVTFDDGRQTIAAFNPGLGPSGNGNIVSVERILEAAMSSAPTPPAPVPSGWVLVPRKPTKEMADAAAYAHYGKKRVDETGIEGMSMTVNGIDYNFWRAFQRFWKGALSAVPNPSLAPVPAREAVEVKPSIDMMRDEAWQMIKRKGWEATSKLSLHSVAGLVSEFGMTVYRGEVGCGYPECGCCADAACEDALNQHPDFAARTTEAEG
jgi:hypothetical protein